MQEVQVQGLDQVARALDELPESIRQAKADIFDRLGRELLPEVQGKIGSRERKGKYLSARPHIRDLQAYYVGTGKGYVAVRPKAKTNVGRYAAGYITNALEGGHVSHTRAGLGYVSGKHMYADSGSRAEALARRAAEEIEAAAEAALEGRT